MNKGAPILTRPVGDIQDGETQHLVSTFLTNITNEFRTPLAALHASVEYLLNDFDVLSREEISELLRSIHLSVTGLNTLVENLIQSANIEAGHFLIRTGAIDLSMVISEAIRFTHPLISRRCQHVVVERTGELPLVIGDPARLTQVMVNLLSNASKSGPMRQTICVSLEASRPDAVLVSVADQCFGFRSDDLQRLFNRFVDPAAADDRPYGNALGLSVARKIIEEHGGTYGVQQRPGDGTVFWFTVPAAQK
jgi:signal transduction histidine kinase